MVRSVVAVGLAALALVMGTAQASAMAGGTPVTAPTEAPWMATIGLPFPGKAAARCGGVLVAPDRVLTAAHCVFLEVPLLGNIVLNPAALRVAIGNAPVNQVRPDRTVRAIAVHPRFRYEPTPAAPHNTQLAALSFDFVLLQLSEPVRGVAPIALAPARPAPGTRLRMYGHGFIPQGGQSDALLSGDLRVISHAACALQTPALVDQESVVCAQAPSVQAGFGDSGGPAVVHDRTGRARLAGVTSFGTETLAREPFRPGFVAFGDVAAARSFITSPHPGWNQGWPATPPR